MNHKMILYLTAQIVRAVGILIVFPLIVAGIYGAGPSALAFAGVGIGMILRGLIAASLLGDRVYQHRLLGIPGALEDANQMLQIMAVDGADIVKPQGIEELPIHKQGFQEVPELFDESKHRHSDVRDFLQAPAHAALEAPIGLALAEAGQIVAHRADVRGNGHRVVV